MVSHDAAAATIELARSTGLFLDEWQQHTIRSWMGERADTTWAAFECAHVVARQNGKGGELEARQLGGLFALNEELQLHTAHEFKTANEHFLRMAGLVEGCSDLRRKVARIRYANGEQGIELKNGARLKFLARSGGAGRGFAGASTVYYDEAMYLAASMVGASLPTLSTHPNPQVVYTGSAGFAASSQLHALRRRALSGDGGRLAYLEHTAESVTLVDGQVVSNRETLDPADRELWAAANPTLGDRIPVEFVESEYRSMPRAEFLRERLGVWEPEPIATRDRVLTGPQWSANFDDGADLVRPESFGLSVSADRQTAAIGFAATLPDGRVHIGVMDHRPGLGLGWVRDRVAEIRANAPGAVLSLNPRSDAGSFLVELEQGGEVHATGPTEYAQACAAFYDAVVEHRLRYRRQRSLDEAVESAGRRSLSGAWAWDGGDEIVPLEAVTLALAAHRAEQPALVFAY